MNIARSLVELSNSHVGLREGRTGLTQELRIRSETSSAKSYVQSFNLPDDCPQ